MADPVAVGHGLYGRSYQDRADGSALVKDQSHEPGEEQGTAGTANGLDDPVGEVSSAAGLLPHANQSTQAPEIDQEDAGEVLGPDRGQ